MAETSRNRRENSKKSCYIEKTDQNSTENRIFHTNSTKRTKKHNKNTPLCPHRHLCSKNKHPAQKKLFLAQKVNKTDLTNLDKKRFPPVTNWRARFAIFGKSFGDANCKKKQQKWQRFRVFGQKFRPRSSVLVKNFTYKQGRPGFCTARLENGNFPRKKYRSVVEKGCRRAGKTQTMTFEDNFF